MANGVSHDPKRNDLEQLVAKHAKSERINAIAGISQLVGWPILLFLGGYIFNQVTGDQEKQAQVLSRISDQLAELDRKTSASIAAIARDADNAVAALSERVIAIEASRFRISDSIPIQRFRTSSCRTSFSIRVKMPVLRLVR